MPNLHPSLRHLPNLISMLRVILVAPIIASLLNEAYELAIWLFVIAGASDGLDGFLAKRFGWASRLGGILDAVADKILLVSSFVALWWLGVFPWWLVAWVLFRDVLIVAGSTFYNFRVETFYAEPSLISKFNTVLQIVLVALAVVNLAWPGVPDIVLQILIWAVMLTVLLSGVDYTLEWRRRAARVGGNARSR